MVEGINNNLGMKDIVGIYHEFQPRIQRYYGWLSNLAQEFGVHSLNPDGRLIGPDGSTKRTLFTDPPHIPTLFRSLICHESTD